MQSSRKKTRNKHKQHVNTPKNKSIKQQIGSPPKYDCIDDDLLILSIVHSSHHDLVSDDYFDTMLEENLELQNEEKQQTQTIITEVTEPTKVLKSNESKSQYLQKESNEPQMNMNKCENAKLANIFIGKPIKCQKIVKEFNYKQIKEARQALKAGQSIKYRLPRYISSQKILQSAEMLGINTCKLRKALTSSMIIKKLIDDYVEKIQETDEWSGNISAGICYLKYVKQVIPLQCNDAMNPRVKIKMNLDYDKYGMDREFKRKFKKQLSKQVFKCSPSNIMISDVKKGSLIVIAAVCLAGLIYCGCIGLTVYANMSDNGPTDNMRGNVAERISQQFEMGQKILIYNKYEATVIDLLGNEQGSRTERIRIKYDGEKPRYFMNTYIYSCDDECVTPLDTGRSISYEAHICSQGSFFQAVVR